MLRPSRDQWRVLWVVTAIVVGLWLYDAPWGWAFAPARPQMRSTYDVVKEGTRGRTDRRAWEFEAIALMSDMEALRLRREQIAKAQHDIRNRVAVVAAFVGVLVFWQLGGDRHGA